MNRLSNLLSLLKPFYCIIGIALCAVSQANPIALDTLSISANKAGIPGLSLAYVDGGKTTQVISYGVRDIDSGLTVTDATVFEAASLSKPVLAYIVCRLVDKGELSLDTPLAELLRYERLTNHEYTTKITPRLVLSHQTGLPNWGGTPLQFNFEPGKRFNYSGEGYVYLQKALEHKLGLSLQAIAEREVFKPLGMTNSAFSFYEQHEYELSRAHSRMDVASTRDYPTDNAASSLHTTASDYAKFMVAFFSGDSLSKTTRNAMMQAQVPLPESRANDQSEALTNNLAWSMGWGLVTDAPSPIYWHWGDNGDFRAFVAYDPTEQKGLVYFANSANGLAISESL